MICNILGRLYSALGCGVFKRYPTISIDIEQIVEQLPGNKTVYYMDKDYWTFANWTDFFDFVHRDNTDQTLYIKDRCDCDDFALLFKAHAALAGVNAVGVIYDWTKGHAYNLVPLHDPLGNLTVYIYEPQLDLLQLPVDLQLQNHNYMVIF